MPNKYTSEQLLQDLPRPMLNFLWYLCYIYYDPSSPEFRVTLQIDEPTSKQRFTVHTTGDVTIQDFGCSINAEILIRTDGTRCIMEYA